MGTEHKRDRFERSGEIQFLKQSGEIQFGREEKYNLTERRNTVWQSGEIQIIARLLLVGGPPRMTECLVGADTRVAAGVYNSLATQLRVIVVFITIVTIIIGLSIGQRPCLC